MNFPSTSSDTTLFDLEHMTPEEWRTLMYNRIVQQKDIFVNDFKNKVIANINECTNHVEPNTTLASIREDLTKKIKENQFDFEYQQFVDGIVGATFEYICQFIIKNSMDNIKRTQNALNTFSSTVDSNIAAIQPRCNEDIRLQEFSKSVQVHCLPESNGNNTGSSGKVIQSHFMNNSTQHDTNSLMLIASENFENTIVSKIVTPSIQNFHKELPQKNNLSLSAEFEPSNINMGNNFIHTAHSSIDLDDDLETTKDIVSIALKISQQEINFKYNDDFDYEKNINNSSSCTSNEIPTNNAFLEQSDNKKSDTHRMEEDYQISNSLKILESLVNIEHSKLQIPSETDSVLQQSKIELNDKNEGKLCSKTDLKNKKKLKLKMKTPDQEKNEIDKEWISDAHKVKSHSLQNNNKKNNQEIGTSKTKNKKLEVQNNLNNYTDLSYLDNTVEMENDLNSLLNNKDSSLITFSNFSEMSETTTSTTTFTKTSSVRIPMTENLPITQFKIPLPRDVENISLKREYDYSTTNATNTTSLKVSTITSTSSSNNEKCLDYSKNKSSIRSGTVLKSSDYKKIYEEDRKSLFSPDIIISSKSTKGSCNKTYITKENGLVYKTNNTKKTVKDDKIQKSMSKTKNTTVSKRPKLYHCQSTKIKNDKDTIPRSGTKSVQNKKSIPLNPNLAYNDTPEFTRNKFKRLRMCDEANTSIKNNVQQVTKYEENSDTTAYNSLPEWIQKLYKIHNIKPLYVVIDPSKIYD